MEKDEVIQKLEGLLERLKKGTTHVVSLEIEEEVEHCEYVGDDAWVRRKKTGKFSIKFNLKLYDHDLNELKSLK